MRRPSGSRAPANTPAGQNNNALLNGWERQPVWKVELYARYKCWRAFHPDSRSCLRPLSPAAKREQDRFGDSSGLTGHVQGLEVKMHPVPACEYMMSLWTSRCAAYTPTCFMNQGFKLDMCSTPLGIYITRCFMSHAREPVAIRIKYVCSKTSSTLLSVQQGEQVMMQCGLNRVCNLKTKTYCTSLFNRHLHHFTANDAWEIFYVCVVVALVTIIKRWKGRRFSFRITFTEWLGRSVGRCMWHVVVSCVAWHGFKSAQGLFLIPAYTAGKDGNTPQKELNEMMMRLTIWNFWFFT